MPLTIVYIFVIALLVMIVVDGGVGVGVSGGSCGVRYVHDCGEYKIQHQPKKTLAKIRTSVNN